MSLNGTTHIAHAPERVIEALTSEDFQRDTAQKIGASLVSLTVDGDTSGPFTLTVERSAPTDRIPDLLKKLVGSTVTVVQTDQFSGPAEDGSRQASTKIDVKGAPVSVKGTQSIQPAGDGSDLSLTGEIASSIPFIGGKLSKMAEPMIGKALGLQAASLDAWLDSH